MIADARRALALVGPRTRRGWFALLPLAVCSASVEAVSAAAVFGLLRIVGDPSQAARLPIAATIYAWLPRHDDQTIIFAFTISVLVLYAGRIVVLGTAIVVEARLINHSIVDMANRLLKAYLEAPYAFVLQRNSAILIQRIRDGTDATTNLILASAIHLFTEALVVVAFLIVLAAAAPLVTLIAAVSLTVFLLLPVGMTVRMFRRWGGEQDALDKTMMQELQQSLGALKEVRVAGAGSFFQERFGRARAAFSRIEQRRAVLTDGLRLAIETTFVVTILLVVLVMSLRGDQGQRAVSLLGLYAYAGFRLVPSANRITRNINNIRGGRPLVHDLETDLLLLARTPPAERASEVRAIHFERAISFEGVSYTYANSEMRTLEGVDLEIRRGDAVGILGPTGSGKSTLVALLLGLLEPTKGRVLVDGCDIRGALRDWQRQIGYVPQECYLLDDTLRSNIAFGVSDRQVDEERVERAVRLARLDEFVATLPRRLDTKVGERGARLSGGQRQRVAIARALYHDPQVLVFDEATAALDLQTEAEITSAVVSLRGSRTIIVIAHRMSTVKGCGRLVLLRNGRVADVGSFDDLVRRDAEFRTTAAAGL